MKDSVHIRYYYFIELQNYEIYIFLIKIVDSLIHNVSYDGVQK